MNYRSLSFVQIASLFAVLTGIAQTVPEGFNYQGQLFDASGQPLPNANYEIAFSLYQDEGSADPLWGPVTLTVAVSDGLFNVVLEGTDGNDQSLTSAFENGAQYLELKIGNNNPISPRQQILSVPYALNVRGISNQNGKLGIGTSNPSGKLTVVNGAIHLGTLGVFGDHNVVNPTSSSEGTEIIFNAPNEGQDGNFHTTGRIFAKIPAKVPTGIWKETRLVLQAGNFWHSFNANQMVLRGNGNVGIGTDTPAHTLDVNGSIGSNGTTYHSDSRWKTDVKPITNAVSKMQNIEGVEFKWDRKNYSNMNFPKGKQIGLIAQNVEGVFPEVVATDESGFKSVDYAKIVPLLIQAIKEQQTQIEQLREEIK